LAKEPEDIHSIQYVLAAITGKNLAETLRDTEADTEGLVGGEEWDHWGRDLQRGYVHSPKMNFSLEMARFVNSEADFS